jgi:homoserine dehydrogenase
MEAVGGRGGQEELPWTEDSEGFVDPRELHTRFYFRIEGSLTDAAMAFGQVEVLSEDGETAFLTNRISGYAAAEQANSLNILACMRVLD